PARRRGPASRVARALAQPLRLSRHRVSQSRLNPLRCSSRGPTHSAALGLAGRPSRGTPLVESTDLRQESAMLQPRPRRASAALVLCLFVTGCASTRSGKAEPGRVPTGGPIYVTSQGAPEFKVARTNPIAGGAVAAAPVVGALGALVLWGVVTVVTK